MDVTRSRLPERLRGALRWLGGWERRTRPHDPRLAEALRRRWRELPDSARTPGQVLGRHGVGCEGTHGVFPKCDLACTPCYHSRDANQVRVDGPHTLARIEEQMALLERRRGPHGHAQLIGGEVSLLSPDDHAEALAIMRRHGREPMSFTHGDVDYDYLRNLVTGPDGRRRFDRVSFAAHFDMFMFGRRGIARPANEAELDPYRREFADKVRRLRHDHGVRSFLAHNMTVSPANLDQVAHVVRAASAAGYRMLSFQPAAFVGDERRWHEDFRATTGDAVWAQIEKGAGARVDYRVFEHGDVRCNRTAYGFFLGNTWRPLLDGNNPRDVRFRDDFFRYCGALSFTGSSPAELAAKLLRLFVGHPQALTRTVGWAARTVRRVGVSDLLRHRPRPVTLVMHQFMDAAEVAPAWELMKRGVVSDDPAIRATQERLGACHYAMAHPENDTLVPACVQHSVLDPVENAALRTLLPIVPARRSDGSPQRGGNRRPQRDDVTTMPTPVTS